MLKLLLVPLWLCHGLVLEASAADERPDAVLCPLSEYIDDNEQVVKEYFECPGHGDPSNHRNCCEDKCCPMVDSVLQLDIQYVLYLYHFSFLNKSFTFQGCHDHIHHRHLHLCHIRHHHYRLLLCSELSHV